MKRMPLFVVVVLAGAFWISAVVMVVVVLVVVPMPILWVVTILDAMLALVFTFFAVQRWMDEKR